jgi:predicted RNase H-like HicB family nuclease
MKKIEVKISFEERKNFLIRIPLLPGCVAAFVKFAEMKIWELTEEMVKEYLDDMKKEKIPIPEEFNEDYEFHYNFTPEAYLNYFDKYLTKASLSQMTGINENQLWYYSSGLRQPRKDQKERINSGINHFKKELESSTMV